MKKVIGIVSEGPTDHMVLKAAIDRITGEENRYLSLQPEPDMMGRFGNGWKGVWRWCKETASINMRCGNKEKDVGSIDEVMNAPFFNGRSLADIAGEITDVEL